MDRKIPDIADLFTYQGRTYRVDAWLKVDPPPPIPEDTSEYLKGVLARTTAGTRLVFCAREDATHVSGVGSDACVAPLAEITITGRVTVPDTVLDADRAAALRLIGAGLYF